MNNQHKILTSCLIAFISFSELLIAEELGPKDGSWFTDILLRQEQTTDLPNNREDIERTRMFIWMELDAPINNEFSFGASIYGNYGTDEADENRANLDNSESSTLEIDQFFLKWNHSESGSTWFGKHYLPVSFSSMVWDPDIFTVGISSTTEWVNEEETEYLLAFGVHRVQHIFSEESELAFAKFELGQFLGDAFLTSSFTAMVFKDTETLLLDNVRRTNTETGLLEGFELAILEASLNFSIFESSVMIGIESMKNFAVDQDNIANRINLRIGDSGIENGLQLSLHYQDVERDAAVAAFNDDDWWFATNMKGYRVSTSFGISEKTSVQVSYFDEDLNTENTKRVFLELRSSF